MGNWTFDIDDDFTLPDGHTGPIMDTNQIERTHRDFAMKCKRFSNIFGILLTFSNIAYLLAIKGWCMIKRKRA